AVCAAVRSCGSRPSAATSASGLVIASAISSCQRGAWRASRSCWRGWSDAVIIRGPFVGCAFCSSSREKEMASYTTSEIRSGLKVLLDNEPYSVVENEFVKPGKGQAFNRIKVRNLKTGRTIERTFRSGESLEAADVVDMEMQYLYQEGEFWHFMVPDNYEQYTAGKSA